MDGILGCEGVGLDALLPTKDILKEPATLKTLCMPLPLPVPVYAPSEGVHHWWGESF